MAVFLGTVRNWDTISRATIRRSNISTVPRPQRPIRSRGGLR